MKVLTVWQPWASLIAIGAKPYEFRGRTPPAAYVGQRIAINAGARKIVIEEVRALLARLQSRSYWQACLDPDLAVPLLRAILDDAVQLPRGAIICTARLGSARDGFEIASEFGMPQEARPNDSDRNQHANFGWPMLDVAAVVPPEPHRGQQGWSEWRAR